MSKVIQAYCVKCRKKVGVKDAEFVTLPPGRSGVRMKAYEGTCPICKTKVFKFIGKAAPGVYSYH